MTPKLRATIVATSGLLAIASILTGCQATTPATDLPDGVTVSVYQPRPDVAKDRIAIEVHNDGPEPLVVTAATIESAYFTEPFVWGPGRTATVQPGYAVDLRVDIPDEVDCSDVAAEHIVSVSWTVGGASGSSVVTPDDPYKIFDLLHDAACLVEAVDSIATLEAVSLEAPAQYPAPAQLVIAVRPTGAEGTVLIDSIHSTTLLNPAGADGVGVAELALGTEISASGPREIRVPIVPNRCDAHALAEDKIGTRMPLYVTTEDGTTGRLVLSASEALRAQMYEFYSDYCGL